MGTRDEATAFLRRMEAEHPTDWLNRSLWPVEDRAAFERWERGELDRKAEAVNAYADGGPWPEGHPPHVELPADVDLSGATIDPLPVTPPEPGAPGDQRGGR